MTWRWRSIILCGLIYGGDISNVAAEATSEETAINRTQAAQMAQQVFGGKVISVDEIEPATPSAESEESTPQSGTRFVVKLMQNGRVRVVNLDAQGTALKSLP